MKGALDFDAINQAALAAFPAVLNRLLPGSKTIGREVVALNPRRRIVIPAHSKSTDITGAGAISLPATRAAILFHWSPILGTFRKARRRGCSPKCSGWKLEGATMGDAFDKFAPLSEGEKAAGFSAVSAIDAPDEEGQLVSPIPSDTADPPETHWTLGRPSQVWTYRDASGETLFYVYRFDPHGERKQFLTELAKDRIEPARTGARRLGCVGGRRASREAV